MPQWEGDCEMVTASLSDVFTNDSCEASDTWMYFDYKHLRHHFKNNADLMKVRRTNITVHSFGTLRYIFTLIFKKGFISFKPIGSKRLK